MHHAPRILLLAALLLLVRAVPSFAQGKSSSSVAAEKIHQWIANELATNPNKKKLSQICDSYDRQLLLEASAALKIPLSDLDETSTEDLMEASQPIDTGLAANVSKSASRCQNETSIAICRTNPSLIIAGANDYRTFRDQKGQPVFVTSNSGQTWATVFIPLHANYTSAGDPVLVSGPDGTLYYAYLLSTNDGLSNIIVASSSDGRIWKNGNPIAKDAPPDGIRFIEDKEQMCVDLNPASPHFGRLYLVWIRFEIDENVFEITAQTLRVTHSDDHGKTWSDPTIIAEGTCQFSSIHLGKNGELFVSFSFGTPEDEHYFYTSTDGGNNFTQHTVASFTDYPPNLDGRDALKGEYGFRCFPYTSFDVDQATNKIHFVYGDYYNQTEAAIHYVTSNDLGNTWTPERIIGYSSNSPEIGDPHDRFCPWVTVNQKTGDALLTYYSSERTDDNLNISAFRTRLNGPATENPKPLELTDFDPTTMRFSPGGQTAFLGDYIGSDVTDTVYAAAWARSNGNTTDGEVYVYVGTPNHPTTAVGPTIVKSDRLRLASVFPNPTVGDDIHFNYYAPEAGHASLVLYSTDGKKIATIWNGELLEGSSIETASVKNITPGAYILSLETAGAKDEMKVVVK